MNPLKKLKKFFSRSSETFVRVKGDNNCVEYAPEDAKFFSSVEINGNGNRIKIHKLNPQSLGKIKIVVEGDNCQVEIGPGLFVGTSLTVRLGSLHEFMGSISGAGCFIGRDVRIEEAVICTYNSNNMVRIGNNCLVSLKVCFYNTDGHPIYDKASGALINRVPDMIIADRCWIGWNASLLKGVSLAEGTIVGWGSVVAKSVEEPFCAVAGNPAKIVRRNVTWKTGPDPEYQRNLRRKSE